MYHSLTPFVEPIIAYRASLHGSHLPVLIKAGESPTGFLPLVTNVCCTWSDPQTIKL